MALAVAVVLMFIVGVGISGDREVESAFGFAMIFAALVMFRRSRRRRNAEQGTFMAIASTGLLAAAIGAAFVLDVFGSKAARHAVGIPLFFLGVCLILYPWWKKIGNGRIFAVIFFTGAVTGLIGLSLGSS